MKKNIVKFISLCLMITMMVYTLPVSAVSADSTQTYYVYGFETFGSVTLYPTTASATTYCEYTSAGKKTRAVFVYINEQGQQKQIGAGSVSEDIEYKYNGDYSQTRQTETPDDFDLPVKAFSKHAVKIKDGITWNSEGCNDRPVAT